MDITYSFPGGARVDALAGDHVIRTDQPPNASAPSPFTLFLASIGACAGVYVQAFCRKRGIDTSDIHIVQRNRIAPDGMVERIDLDIALPADFPEQYRAAVVRSAEQCTVKQHLEHPPAVVLEATIARPDMAGAL